MQSLKNKNIILGVTAGIAAYKAAELARLLVKSGAHVQVVMTPSANEFISGLTFQAITGKTVRESMFDSAHEAAMGHIELARWADLIVIAPASADFIAKLRAGMADTLLHTLCLASSAPLFVAPAMNQQMWAQASTQENVTTLWQRGTHILGPAEGEQACGDTGPGRLLEPDLILSALAASQYEPVLQGINITITAGPTQEAIDPVRFIGNRSSGKMGFALATSARLLGANVHLVAGPVSLATPNDVHRTDVRNAADMHSAVMRLIANTDIFIGCAAVADYRPAQTAEQKIKKDNSSLTIELIRNPDILADVAMHSDRPFCVGFAAETDDLDTYARAKLKNKKLDIIAANWVGKNNSGFESNDNALHVIWHDGSTQLPLQNKNQLAQQLMALIAEHFHASTST